MHIFSGSRFSPAGLYTQERHPEKMKNNTILATLVAVAFSSLVACKTDKAQPPMQEQASNTPLMDRTLTEQKAKRPNPFVPVVDGAYVTPYIKAHPDVYVPLWLKAHPEVKMTGENEYTMPDGTWLYAGIEAPVIDGATSFSEFRAFETDLADEVHTGLDPVARFKDLDECKRALRTRIAPIDKNYNFVLGFHWIGDGITLRVVDVVAPKEMWPDVFDDEAKSCWRAVFVGHAFPSELKLDRVIEDTFCFNQL